MIYKIKKKLLILILLPFIVAAAEFSDYTTLINQKMETEKRLQDHVSGVVERIVGEGNSSVIISIETTDLKKSQVTTEQWLENKQDQQEAAPQREEYLPGVPLRDTMQETSAEEQSPEKSGGKRVEDIITLPSEFIQSVRVSLLLDNSVPDDLVATVDNVVNDVLGLDPARGDRVSIQRVDFAGKTVDLVGFLFNPYFYIISLVLITLIILGLFLFGPLRKFLFATLQTLKDLKEMKGETEYSGAGGGGSGVGGMAGG
ncbi:MAG: hypothetical protein PF545_04190, partial [Elusimicrobia bacterium]|nr:hypothetical protein [Elusimicrobiota bacterium]